MRQVQTVRRLLIANRGEIACRIIRTCKRLEIHSIAVYSDADCDALHVKLADEAHRLGPSESKLSYLNTDKVLEVAKSAQADAIHPGYGFLSENSDFAKQCKKAGIVFVGPSAEAISLFGDKVRSKELAKKVGIPIIPSIEVDGSEKVVLKNVKEFASEVGYPILLKASAGGGGRGMRRIDSDKLIEEGLVAAAREAKAFFNDKRLFAEKLVMPARHIEVQIFGDKEGNAIHLYDRDCTMQRNYQKVIEEAPAPNIPDELRIKLYDNATSLASAAKYENAGTVEFLVQPDGGYYFIEANSRLQVEHPVTEELLGLDLVELQLRIAGGTLLKECVPSLPKLPPSRSSVECRLCAELAEDSFLPAAGVLNSFYIEGTGIRIDTGFQSGDRVSHFYDSLLGKIISTAENRKQALNQLLGALSESTVSGVYTNAGYLCRLLKSKQFRESTHNLRTAVECLPNDEERAADNLMVGGLYILLRSDPSQLGWRMFDSETSTRRLFINDSKETISVSIKPENKFIFKNSAGLIREIKLLLKGQNSVSYVFDDIPSLAILSETLSAGWLSLPLGTFQVIEDFDTERSTQKGAAITQNKVSSPLPGKVLELKVKQNDQVKGGDVLVVIESMKMEHRVLAPQDGTINNIAVKAGDSVAKNAVLITLS